MHGIIPVSLTLLICTCVVADEPDAALQQDYAAIGGTWQREMRDEQGRTLVVTKSEQDGMSLVTIRDAQGKILHSHHSQYKLERSGEVRIFRYWNRTVTDGPDKGRIDTQTRSYIYRIHADRFYEIHGLLLEDTGRPSVIVWERVERDDMVARPRSTDRGFAGRIVADGMAGGAA